MKFHFKVYNINSDGLSMPGIEVSTEGSSPREMVIVDGMVYFTNWNTSDVKVFNLYTYNFCKNFFRIKILQIIKYKTINTFVFKFDIKFNN